MARAGPNLLAAIKDDFISALEKYPELGERRSHLVYLFLAASIDANAGITHEEIQIVMANLPEDGLVDVADFFENRLGNSEGDRSGAWKNIYLPWLRDYWPKAEERSSTKTSIALVRCLIKTGGTFPEALQWAEEFLRPGTADAVLWHVQKSGIHQSWPADTLKMLTIMIPGNIVENWNRQKLQEILNQMQETDQNIARDQRFQRLYGL